MLQDTVHLSLVWSFGCLLTLILPIIFLSQKCLLFTTYSNAMCTILIMEANTLNHDQTAQSDLGPYWLDARKPVFGGLRTTKAQTSLRIRADWSAPFYSLFGIYHIEECFKRNINVVASLCSFVNWLKFTFHWNPEDRFCRDEAHIVHNIDFQSV